MFKKLSMAVCLIACTNFAYATQDSNRNMAIAISPIQAVLLSMDLLYQYKITDFMAITTPIKFSYSPIKAKIFSKLISWSASSSDENKVMGFSFGVGSKFFMSSPKSLSLNDSFYLEPRLVFNYNNTNIAAGSNYYANNSSDLDLLFIIGQDWLYDSGLFMNLEGGLGAKYIINNKIAHKLRFSGAEIFLGSHDTNIIVAATFDFKMGYAF